MLLQCAANAGYVSIPCMCSTLPTDVPVPTVTQPTRIVQLQTELAAVQAELTSVRAERDQFAGALADLLADQVQLRMQLTQTQAQLAALDVERHDLRQELVD